MSLLTERTTLKERRMSGSLILCLNLFMNYTDKSIEKKGFLNWMERNPNIPN